MKDDSYGREEEMSLPDLQRYVESENQRLENDNGFWAGAYTRSSLSST
jgi:hypothetical protein